MIDTLIATFMKLLPRLLLPFLLLTLTFASISRHDSARELLAPLSQGADPSTQRFVSSLIGITAGAIAGGDRGAEIGYAVALSAEANNRQLHQKEIAWIKSHAADFSSVTGLSPENAQRLLTLAAKTLVDGKTALGNLLDIQALLERGFTQEQVAYAQKYLRSNTHGETFYNAFAEREETLFTVDNPVEFLSSYDPNRPAAGQIAGTVLTDAAGTAAAGALAKIGGTLFKIGGKYYTKLRNGTIVEVPKSAVGKEGSRVRLEFDSKGNVISREPDKAFNYSQKVLDQMDRDIYHGFPSLIDDIALKHGVQKTIQGGDGVMRTKVTLPGSINGKSGAYEWIVEPNGIVNHRLFNTRE